MHPLSVRWIALVLLVAAPASAQGPSLEVEIPEPDDADVSEDALIRWASNEVRVYEGRPRSPERVPIVPDAYLTNGGAREPMPNTLEEDITRVLAEISGGAIGYLIGGGIGAALIWGAHEANANPDWMMVSVAAGAVLGAMGITGGVLLAGDLTGGQGNFGHAFLGQALGSLLALPLVVLGLENDMPELAFVAAGVLPLAGAVLAYEVAHGEQGSRIVLGPTGIAGTIP
jgi:hypothetical protein